MDKNFFEKRCRYSIRKFTVGAASVMIGASFFAVQGVSADEVKPTELDSLENQVHPEEQKEKPAPQTAALQARVAELDSSSKPVETSSEVGTPGEVSAEAKEVINPVKEAVVTSEEAVSKQPAHDSFFNKPEPKEIVAGDRGKNDTKPTTELATSPEKAEVAGVGENPSIVENHIIDVSTFQADKTGQKDSTKAVQDAIEAAKKLKGNVTIVFPKGEYQFYPDQAVSKEYYISNTVGADQRYKDKKIGILLKDMENVTIDGSDSKFIFHGKMTTFATDHSKNITFKNFSVDFKVPTVVDLYTESVSGNTVIYQVPDEFPYEIDGRHINWKSDISPYTKQSYWTGRDKFNYTQIHDTKTGLTFRASNPIFDNVSKIEDLGNRRLKFTYTSRNDSIKEGYSYQMRPTVRDHAGTFFIDSENITLDHLNIHFLHGFGMVYQTSKDFTVNDVHFATPKDSKRTTAGYADFIQVSGSKGHVLIQNSSFENPHDDPINVHGTFLEVVEKIANNKVKVRYKHNETAGFPSFFVGDQVEFLTKGNMIAVPNSVRTVTAVDGPSGRDHEKNLTDIILTFDREIPDTVTAGSHVAENISYTPSVTIKNNTFKSVPTRGILVTTRQPVVIENNTFDGMGMASIYISSDAQGWYESGGVKDVTIRNNTFYGRSNAPMIYIEPTNPTVSTENTVHEHIKVENNHFYVGNTAVLDAKSVKDLQFKNNSIDRYESNVSVDLSSSKVKLNLAETSQLSAQVTGLKRTAPLYRFNGVKEAVLENNSYAGGLNVSMVTQHQATSDVTVKEKTEVPAGTDHVLDVSPTIHYLSSKPEIASVDENGAVTAKAEGEVSITAYVELAGKRYGSQPVLLHVVNKSAVQNNRLDTVTIGQTELDVTPETISGVIAKPKEMVTIQAENPAAKLEVSYRGQTLRGTGTIAQELDFYKGENEFQVKVTAPDGSEKDYRFVLSGIAEKDLSDEVYDKSSTTGWGTIKKNESVGGHTLSLKSNGELKTFDKGIGIHANGHLIYDIAGKGYQQFTALVGVDGESTTYGDMKFRFVIDGKEVHTTSVMQAGSDAEKVVLDISQASKFEIFVDKVSTDWDDHASIVEAKFITGLKDYVAAPKNEKQTQPIPENSTTQPVTPAPTTPEKSSESGLPADYNSKYHLNYDKPAAMTYDGWEKQALPVGNGEMGAKVFGLVGAEKIQYNEKTLWSGGPRPDSTDYNGGNYKDRYKVMADIRKALETGDVSTAKKLAEHNLVGPSDARYGRYLSFGDIFLDFTNQSKELSSVTDYHRGLDISTAITSTSYTQDGTNFNRETFSSFPDDVTVTHLTQKGDKKLDFTLGMDLTRDLIDGGKYKKEKSNFKDGTVTATEDGILLKGIVKDNGLNFASYLGIKTDGKVTVADNHLKVAGASYATLLLSAKTDFAQNPKTNYRKDIDVEKTVKDIVTKAKAKDYQSLKDSHIKDYQALFNRVKLNLGGQTGTSTTKDLLTSYNPDKGQALEELFFQYGRYLLITSSRDKQDALPANLQGVWNGVDNPPWNADYHLNVNLQMNYWPVYSTNLAENAKPLINYIDDMRYFGRIAAKEYAGIESKDGQENGWLVHTQATPFGWTTPGWNYYWGWSPAANAWIMQNVYDHYKFTHDEEYLKDKIYPMLKETAKFWNSFLHYDKASDRWVSSPSYSPEHGTITIGNTFDQSLVWQLFHDYMEAANHLNVDQDFVKEVQAKFEKLKPLHINKAGQIKEWYEEDTPVFTGEGVQKGHRHASHLVGLFPGTLFSKDNPEYLEAARASLNDRGDGGTGWSKANKINLWARLLDGNRAHRLLAEQLRSSTLENLWDTHAPFQIDGNFGATSGMTEMLLQSHTGYVAPLPALPDAWKDGEVSGLVARGNFESSMKWADKNLEKLSFTSNSGGDLVVDYPNIEHTLVKVNGKEVKPTLVKGNRIQVATQKGDFVTFENFTGRVTKLTAERKDSVTAAMNFNAVKGATHYIIERTASADEGQAPAVRRFVTNDTNFIDRTVDSAHTYTYKVQAILGNVETPVSDPAVIDVLSYVFDDRDQRIQYGSAYGDWADSSLYGGTEKFADITDSNVSEEAATATLSFTGVGIEVYGLKSDRLGLAKVTIDGKPMADMDFYDTSSQKGVLVGRYAGLTDGPHTMTITVKKEHKGRTNERAKVSLDYFKVLQGASGAVEKIDDRDARIQYGSAFGDWSDAELYAGTEKYADINNSSDLAQGAATATIPFTGTGIRVYGLKTAALGKALLTLDGKPMPALDFHTDGATQKGTLIGEFTGLPDGKHTLTLTVDPASPQGKKKISLDSFEILKAAAVTLDSPSLAPIMTADKEVVVTLPTSNWDALALKVPGVKEPLILTKQDDTHVRLGEEKVLDVVENAVRVPLPDMTDRRVGGVIEAYSVLGKTLTSPVVTVFAEPIKPAETPTPGSETEQTTPVKPGNAEKPIEEVKPTETVKPDKPAETPQPGKPADEVKPTETVKPEQSSKPAETPQPNKPSEEAKPAETPQPSKPTEEVKPSETAEPNMTTTPAENPRRELKVFTDKATGVMVIGNPEVIGSLDHLEVQKVGDQALAGKSYDAFDIKLKDKDNHEIQPKGAVMLHLPVKPGAEVENVFYVTPSKELQALNFTQKGDAVEFATSHFSIYAVVYKQATPTVEAMSTKVAAPASPAEKEAEDKQTLPNTGDSSNASLLFLASLSLALSALFYMKGRKD